MAATLQNPSTRSASRCTPAIARGTHTFEISGYSLHRGIGAGNFICSAAFDVCGYKWCIRCYPDGDGDVIGDSEDYIAIYVELLSEKAKVRMVSEIELVNQTTQLPIFMACNKVSYLLSTMDPDDINQIYLFGVKKFMKRIVLEESEYLRDDCVVIQCHITVIKEPPMAKTVTSEIEVPPSDLSVYFGKLLESDEGADVTFSVEGEVFSAHRIVLAARSPVFKAELYGSLGECNRDSITIEDMQPGVFKALLHFIYTDSLPTMEELDGNDNSGIAMHLLEAADRYAVERLKLVCESILCKSLDVKNVATILSLADQHNCSKLKDVCIKYINSPNIKDDVEATQGFVHLKRACPSLFIDMWKKATKNRKI